MSTTDQEQVTPTVEAKLSSDEVKALREKKDQLSTSIRQTVLDSKAKLPEEGSAQQLRSEHVQLTEQAETANQQTERLTEAKLQVEPLVQECQGLEKELATARESLSEFYQPLGVAAFAAQLAGQIKDVSAQADRLVVHEKVTQLQQESEALTPSADAKMLEKAKAKAQQLAAAGKIIIEETQIGKLDKQSGQQLLGERQEETVRCDETSAILDQISERRAEIVEKEGKVAASTAAFTSSRDEVTKKLDLPPFDTVAELDIQIKENNTLTASAQKQLTLLERELPERLMADEELRSSDSELGQQVQELAEIQAQLKTAGPSLAGLWSTVKEVVVRRKRTVAVIAVLLVGIQGFATYQESKLNKATQQQIAAAASAWEAGTQKEAAAIYRDLMGEEYIRFVSAEDKETVFHRLIEYDVAHEARPEAKRLVQQAMDEKIKLSLESPAARSLLAEVEKEIEEERAAKLAALAKKKRAEEKRAEEEKEKLAKQEAEDEYQARIDSRIKAEKDAEIKARDWSTLTVKSTKEYVNFVDNTSEFKGRIVKMIGLEYMGNGNLRDVGSNLGSLRGSIPFKTPYPTNLDLHLDVWIGSDLNRFKSYDDLPNIASFALVTVFFYCKEGKLRSGNLVTLIERD